MKVMKCIGIMIIAIVVLILGAMIIMTLKAGKEMRELPFQQISMVEVEDGVYQGKRETTFVKVEVETEVKDHEIIRIDILRHENGRGSKAEEITKEMVKQNTYDVDAVSGATMSSKVIKSAMNDALLQGKE